MVTKEAIGSVKFDLRFALPMFSQCFFGHFVSRLSIPHVYWPHVEDRLKVPGQMPQ